MTTTVIFKSDNYFLLLKLLKEHFDYTLIAYPGSDTPRLVIMAPSGQTILGARYDTVILFITDLLRDNNIDFTLEDDDA